MDRHDIVTDGRAFAWLLVVLSAGLIALAAAGGYAVDRIRKADAAAAHARTGRETALRERDVAEAALAAADEKAKATEAALAKVTGELAACRAPRPVRPRRPSVVPVFPEESKMRARP